MAVIGSGAAVTLDNIVLATDFSPASESAGLYARALAKRFSSTLTIANVIDLSVATRSEDALVGLPIEQMRHDSAENLERISNEFAGIGIRVKEKSVEAHKPPAATVRLAEDLDADLLVIGTHARRGLSKFVLGSFAEGVIHHARCPVLTVGPNVKVPDEGRARFRTVVFATDLQHQTVQKAAIALAITEDSVGRIILCHVLEHPPSALTDSLEQQFKTESILRDLIPDSAYDWCSPECEVEYGHAVEAILRLAERAEADLIVLGARRSKTWLTHAAEGVAAQVIHEARCPVLTICSD